MDVPYFLNKYDPDPLRYYLTATAPETKDTPTAVLLGGFRRAPGGQHRRAGRYLGPLRVGNRMLSFAYKHFRHVPEPEPGVLDDAARELLAHVEAGFQAVGELYAGAHFRAALAEAIALAREANGYLDRKAPWVQIKQDRATAATTVYVTRSVRVVDNLKTLLAPVLPHTAQKLHEYLGYEGQLFGTQRVVEYQETTRSHLALTYDYAGAIGTWVKSALPVGQALRPPAPLVKKLEEAVVPEGEEYARMWG